MIGIGGVAFAPFAALFGKDALPVRASIVSDSDVQPSGEDLADSDRALSPRAQHLQTVEGDNVQVFLASRTLEWDLVAAGNWTLMLAALAKIKPRVAKALGEQFGESTPMEQADQFLAKVADVKGQFAQELADLLANASHEFHVPNYLQQAIQWVTVLGDEAL